MSKHSQANGITNGAVQKRPKWVKTSHRSTNTHDVRAILCIGKKVSTHVSKNGRGLHTFQPYPVKNPSFSISCCKFSFKMFL